MVVVSVFVCCKEESSIQALLFDVFPMEDTIYHIMYFFLDLLCLFEMEIFFSSQNATFIEPVRIKCLSNAVE